MIPLNISHVQYDTKDGFSPFHLLATITSLRLNPTPQMTHAVLFLQRPDRRILINCPRLPEVAGKNRMMVQNPFSSPVDLPSSKGVILVVDDESAFCDVVCEILEAIGYDPHYALDAAEALQMLPQINPDLILSDVMMPEMDGLSFVRHLRGHTTWKALPVIIVSAKATTQDRRSALESGATDFLAKPFSSYDLEELIERNLHSDGH